MELTSSSYGKGNVKFLKVHKDSNDPNKQDVLEANVQVLLRGNFDISYTKADNSTIVPTDTIKNTILVEAHNADVYPIEKFASHLVKHFTKKYLQVEGVEVTITQKLWGRYTLSDKSLHPHSFKDNGPETRSTYLNYDKKSDKVSLSSSIKGLTLLKSTGSMFYGFNQCDYTTLKPTNDRILSTDVDCTYSFDTTLEKLSNLPFDLAYSSVRQITLDLFALENSPSVQATMYNMSKKILETVPEISSVSYQLPNKHYILFDLGWKGLKNDKLFYPSPDPNGLIKSEVRRSKL